MDRALTGGPPAILRRVTKRPIREPYFIGKPNPLMMRSASTPSNAHSETAAMIGDRMDTDVVAGIEAGMETVLVLSGVTTGEQAERFPFRASRVADSIADLIEELG